SASPNFCSPALICLGPRLPRCSAISLSLREDRHALENGSLMDCDFTARLLAVCKAVIASLNRAACHNCIPANCNTSCLSSSVSFELGLFHRLSNQCPSIAKSRLTSFG